MVRENVGVAVQNHLDTLYYTQNEKNKKRNILRKEIKDLEKQLDNLIDLATVSDSVSDVLKKRINDLTIG